jgi:alpha-amylase
MLMMRALWIEGGSVHRCRPFRRACCTAASLLLAAGSSARADNNQAILQWFETRWVTIEHRMPDWYVAGYDAVWLPPVCKAPDPTSAGFDVFDRFDLGSPEAPTAYGTDQGLRALVAEFHRASGQVYVDWIMNHNSGRTSNAGFIAAGGWPGFVINRPGDFWGDFHDGTTQSENPGAPNYNLWTGDLVGLIDIAQEENIQVIRHPVEEGNPQNIMPGTVRNRPSPANRRFYPDRQLQARNFVNPSNNQPWTVFPFNLGDATAGDAVSENAAGLLMRATQWFLEDVGVDGFRLDAAKHVPQWFWNDFWDAIVFQNRRNFAGNRVTPFSFVESVAGNDLTQTYIRKDGFGFRDALDLNEAGQLRDIRGARGLGSWQNVLDSTIDRQDDNANNGTQGVHHVYSHDNGSTDASPPPLPGAELAALPQNAYVLFRNGVANVYHNSRESAAIFQQRGFWPDEGNPSALGLPDENLTRLVRISNGYARGDFSTLNHTDPVNQSLADVLVFERRTPTGGGNFTANVLVALNDSYSNGVMQRNVQTSFPPGTRLHELTGNHADPVVDASGAIPELLVVGADRRVLVTVPNNRNTGGVEHHRGYVVYGPAAPTGMLELLDGDGQPIDAVIAPDPVETPSYRRRLTPVTVVANDSFSIRLITSKTDPLDPNWDDNALFRIDQGFRDFNANGSVDIGDVGGVVPGYEQFLTQRRPLFTSPGFANGLYLQNVDATLLDEGTHYLSVIAFRRRSDGGDAIYGEFRAAFYVDRLPPVAMLANPDAPIESADHAFRVSVDRTVNSVHVIFDVPPETDPLTLVAPSNRAAPYDRFEWRRSAVRLTPGAHSVTVVAFEATGRSVVERSDVFVSIGSGDVNGDGETTIDDLFEGYMITGYNAAGDIDQDGDFDAADLRLLEQLLRAREVENMARPQR